MLARLLDMTPTRLRQLVQEGVIPAPPRRGQYHFVPSVQAYVRHLRSRAIGRPGSTAASAATLAEETLRWRTVRRQRAEFELARAQGEHVEIDLVAEAIFELGREQRDRLQGLPARHAAVLAGRLQVDPNALRTALEDMLRDYLAETPPPDLKARVRAKSRAREAAAA